MMRGIEELERTLANLAAAAPDGAGIVEAARAEASRIKRRRRILTISAASAVLVVVIAVPAAISGLGRQAPDPAVPDYRGRLQLTVDLAPGSGFIKVSYGASGRQQYINAGSSINGASNGSAQISVFDPGTFDPGRYDDGHLLGGERVIVQGQTAYYDSDFLIALTPDATGPSSRPLPRSMRERRVPTLAWQDASGAWVLTFTSRPDPKSTLLRFAEFVRITAPRDVTAPFSLGYIPGGLDPHSFGRRNLAPDETLARDVYVGFGAPTNPPMEGLSESELYDNPLSVMAFGPDSHPYVGEDLGPTTQVAGYDVWYVTTRGRFSIPENGSVLMFKHNTCFVQINVGDRDRIPLSELTRMLEGARFYDCTDPTTWVRPMS